MILAGILPLLFTRIVNQQTEARYSTSISAMLKLRRARLGVNGCIISGIVLGSLYGLMPLYLKHQGMANASIGFWMAVLVSAGILGQWPMGRLADKFGRLLVLRVQVFVVILGSIAMLTRAAMAPALFILGRRVLRFIRSRWHGPVKSRTPPACGNEPGSVVKLYGREPVGAVFYCDVNAELFR